MQSISPISETLAGLIGDGRPREALAQLDTFSMYRCTGLYAFEGDMLRNVLLYDRDDPTLERGDGAPVAQTYGAFLRDPMQPFELADSLVDARVSGHPKQYVVRSYLGVPIVGSGGECIGSLCCFDFTRVIAPEALRRLMCEAAPLFRPVVEDALRDRDPVPHAKASERDETDHEVA